MVGPIAWRHSDRARTFIVLFSYRHLHRSQHSAQPGFLALLNLSALKFQLSLGRCTHGLWPVRSCELSSDVRTAHRAVATASTQNRLDKHVRALLRCRRCPRMQSAPVSGGAIVSDVMIIGQAPGPREPTLKRPFAHTAGKTLFRWFEQSCGMDETAVRSKIYFAAVCPAKIPAAATGFRHRMKFATARCGSMKRFGFCSRVSLFQSVDWRSFNLSTAQNWKP